MTKRAAALALSVALGLSACAENATSPLAAGGRPAMQAQPAPKGTGLVLNSLTGLSLPLIGSLGNVTIDQAVITNFALVENTIGQIVGLQANGVLQLTGGVLGTNVVTQNFSTTASVTSSGPGQCSVATIDLGQISISALGLASVDVPAATVNAKGSGAVGSLLCNLGQFVGGLGSGGSAGAGAQGVVTAINNQIGG
jgi:hypothetical protein